MKDLSLGIVSWSAFIPFSLNAWGHHLCSIVCILRLLFNLLFSFLRSTGWERIFRATSCWGQREDGNSEPRSTHILEEIKDKIFCQCTWKSHSTFPLVDVIVQLLKGLVVRRRWWLIRGICVLRQVGMGQGLLGVDALVRVQLQHLLKQVDGWKEDLQFLQKSFAFHLFRLPRGFAPLKTSWKFFFSILGRERM